MLLPCLSESARKGHETPAQQYKVKTPVVAEDEMRLIDQEGIRPRWAAMLTAARRLLTPSFWKMRPV